MSKTIKGEIRALLESSPICATIAGEDGRFAFVNQRALDLMGCSEAEILGTAVEDRYHDDVERRAILAALRADGEVRDREVRLSRPDGSWFWALMSIRPWRVEGVPVHVSWIADISERKAAEARFRVLLESAHEAVVIVDRDGRIVQINRQLEQLFGYLSHSICCSTGVLMLRMTSSPSMPRSCAGTVQNA